MENPNSNKPLKTIFPPLVMAAGLIFFQAYMIAPLIPKLATIFNVSEQRIGLIVPAYMLAYGVSVLFYGLLSDKFGRKRILQILQMSKRKRILQTSRSKLKLILRLRLLITHQQHQYDCIEWKKTRQRWFSFWNAITISVKVSARGDIEGEKNDSERKMRNG